jgi:hypothetical protein
MPHVPTDGLYKPWDSLTISNLSAEKHITYTARKCCFCCLAPLANDFPSAVAFSVCHIYGWRSSMLLNLGHQVCLAYDQLITLDIEVSCPFVLASKTTAINDCLCSIRLQGYGREDDLQIFCQLSDLA